MAMKITGVKRWFVVVLCALMAGIMVYVPFLRYSYYDQMCVLFTQYKQIVPPETVNTFIGDFGMAFGIVSMLGYPFGGIFADRFNEKWLLIAGGCLMGLCSFWFGLVPGKISIIIIHLLYGVGTSFLIWSAYLKLTRKMGNAREQGRMFSTSEFVRGIFGMLIGFAGVGLLGGAVLPSGEISPELLGVQWRISPFLCPGLFLYPVQGHWRRRNSDPGSGKLQYKKCTSCIENARHLADFSPGFLLFLLYFRRKRLSGCLYSKYTGCLGDYRQHFCHYPELYYSRCNDLRYWLYL